MMAEHIDRYGSPEALALVSSAPLAVCELIFFVTEGDRHHIALLRDGRGDSETWKERYAIIWVARQFTHASFPQIGRAMAHDHSSVVRGYNQAQLLRRTDREFCALTVTLATKLRPRHAVQKRARQAMNGVGRR